MRYSLQLRLLFPILVTFMLTIAILFWLVDSFVVQFEQRTNQARLEQEVTLLEKRILENTQELKSTATLIATEPTLVKALATNNTVEARTASVRNRLRYQVDYLGLVRNDAEFMFGEQPLLSDALADLVSSALISIEDEAIILTPEGLMLVIAKPIRNVNGIQGAVLIGRQLDNFFWREVNLNRTDPTIAVYTPDGAIVASSTQSSIEENAVNDLTLWQQAQTGELAMNSRKTAVYLPLAESQIIYSIQLDVAETAALRGTLFTPIIITIFVVGIFLSISFLYFLRRIVITPIYTLSEATKQIKAGEAFHIPHSLMGRKDEIGQLSDTFAQISDELQETFTLLEQRVEERTVAFQQARDEAITARLAAETASKAKSSFLANMSHELRTPLAAIIGYSELLEEQASIYGYTKITPRLHKINLSAKHLLAMINDILDLSKIEAGKMDIEQREIKITDLVEQVVATAKPLIEKNNNIFHLASDSSLTKMYGDQTRVQQILLNLLSNAAKFTQSGRITLIIQPALNRANFIQFKVKDTGIGMTPAQIEQIFQPFSQADVSTTRQYGGTGLGLAICQQLINIMGGEIDVESILNEGSTFTVSLPLLPSSLDTYQLTDIDEKQSYIPKTETPKGLILIIDDSLAAREQLAEHLLHIGFAVETADSGEKGLQLAKQLQPDAITLDIFMPTMDGWRVLAALKETKECAHIPVILVSVVDGRQKGFTLGASDFLLKPINRTELHQVVQKHYQSHPANEQPILVVEDNDDLREYMRDVLETNHWQVIEAGNGEEGLTVIAETRPSLILLDLMMPKMDGFAFLKVLRAEPQWRSIPVIIITARELSMAERLQLNSHVQQILHKGEYQIPTLLSEISELLESNIIAKRDAIQPITTTQT